MRVLKLLEKGEACIVQKEHQQMIKATSSVSDVLVIIYIIYWTKCYEPRETKEYGYTTSLSLITFILSITTF